MKNLCCGKYKIKIRVGKVIPGYLHNFEKKIEKYVSY